MLLMHKSQIDQAEAIEPQVRACISLSWRRPAERRHLTCIKTERDDAVHNVMRVCRVASPAMASHGMGGATELLLGSETAKVLTRSPDAVLVHRVPRGAHTIAKRHPQAQP